jgi:pSer/pThr/pTyr-binding forkhead associated (FHA) protein
MDDEEKTLHPDLAHPYLPTETQNTPLIKVYSGPLKGKEYLLAQQDFIIGRDSGSDIVLEEKLVSRKHAMITRKTCEYVICDLDSTNGIYVNNLKLNKAVLKHGDMFQIGSSLFQFIWQRKGESI